MALSFTFNGHAYNTGDYNAGTNPYGLGGGGARTIWNTFWGDVMADVAAALQMTATDSVTIGTGTKTFTPVTMRGVVAGMQLLATYNGSNYMFGTITAVTATQVTMTVASGFTTGSGTYSSWTLQPCGPPGAVSFASDAQAKAGASTSVAITPANLAAVISALMGKRSDVSTSAALSAFTRSRVTASVSPTLPTFAADEWLIVERDTTAGDVTIVCSAQTIDGVAADFVMDRNKDIILFYCTSAGVVVTKYLGVLPT